MVTENKILDVRGMPCPAPVVHTKKLLESIREGGVEVLVDSESVRDNIVRLAETAGFDSEVRSMGGGYAVNITRSSCLTRGAAEGLFGPEPEAPLVFLLTSRSFGQGESELGDILMRSFLYTLVELGQPIRSLLFMNSAVFLTTQGSEVLDSLRALETRGVEILSCGTCLDYHGITERLAVGRITNMYASVDALTLPGVRTVVL